MLRNFLRLHKICLILGPIVILLVIFGRILTFSEQKIVRRPDRSNPYMVKASSGPELQLLPNLSAIAWPNPRHQNETDTIRDGFDVAFNVDNYDSVQALLLKLQSVMISLNLQDQWFLGAATLMGSQRHHDLVPWDDDVDVYINFKYRSNITKALKALKPKFNFHKGWNYDKFFFGSNEPSNLTWNWPFIDISYFKRVNQTYFHNEWYGQYFFKVTDAFPTLYRPLGHNWFPTPRRPLSFLQVYYSSNRHVCTKGFWFYATENGKKQEVMPCSQLAGRYAFVQRCPVPRKERKKLGDTEACDEYLLFGNGTSIHKVRTFLDCTFQENPMYMVTNNAFSCP